MNRIEKKIKLLLNKFINILYCTKINRLGSRYSSKQSCYLQTKIVLKLNYRKGIYYSVEIGICRRIIFIK